MVSLEPIHGSLTSIDAPCSPRISFSAEFSDENNFISITPNPDDFDEDQRERAGIYNAEFDFLSSSNSLSSKTDTTMLSADELFSEGKLLPFCQTHHSEILSKLNLKSKDADLEKFEDEELTEQVEKEENNNNNIRVNWFVDDDPSPRPPKCTVLWKELLKLKKKQRASSLSPSSSSSSSSSSSRSLADVAAKEDGKEESKISKEKQYAKKIKKGLEGTKSVCSSIRIRPIVSMPVCSQEKSSSLPPLFPLKKGRISER